ncbi:hypothetical protein [Bosea sp. (in: a-proteobacteria)]|uniref:spike base protein, RCAP_Rcc01079 family n=1 Tax=Bosea sp. (in: a-proteobacteria) TaxID=1871050 RepID=UPI00260757A3|nr:hypothetical protein [Bosea sp. (in: a-proteobacteria)]MCO5092613.1 hypothetical protein [Bosea sp. (in: a-proteobacteria)]
MPAKNRYANNAMSAIGPAVMLRAVTPHDSDELEYVTNGIVAGVAGTIAVVALEDASPVALTVIPGQLLPIRARKIMATGTTATGIVALIS